MKLRTICLLIFTLVIFANGVNAEIPTIWVSPDGNDNNPGTSDLPMKSILMAQRRVREMRRLNDLSLNEGIEIILRGGTYQLDEPLLFRPEDSGSPESVTIFKAAPGEEPIISGGIPVIDWEKAGNVKGLPISARGKIWMADAPIIGGRRLEFRQLWVNGKKAIRASSLDKEPLNRILSVDKGNEAFWIAIPEFDWDKKDQLEFVIHQWWAIAILRVKNIEKVGEKAKITFYQPESRIEFEHPWPAPFIDASKSKNGNSAYYFTNTIGLLDQPGEWYEDINAGKVYYWPRQDESMTTAQVIVPSLETLVKINGTLDNPVTYINFEGIRFEHTSWNRPSEMGHVPLQAGMSLLDAYKLRKPGTPDKAGLENQAWLERQKACVQVSNSGHINFKRCRFSHLAATGIDFISGTSNDIVEGCILSDIAGTGIQMGFFGDAAFEAHLPYNPADVREVCHNETIENNLITDCTNEDWGCVGISVGFARGINIKHNEVSYVNYSGICVGWGWTKTINCMRDNLIHANNIHHFARQMYDVGGIYMLSAQPNTEISNNSIHYLEKAPYAHDPDHFQYIYLDEGSSYIRAVNNWTEKDKFFSNTPGPGNEWSNNGPQVSEDIKNAAGLEPEYRILLNLLK
jgi:hypothetical protein